MILMNTEWETLRISAMDRQAKCEGDLEVEEGRVLGRLREACVHKGKGGRESADCNDLAEHKMGDSEIISYG